MLYIIIVLCWIIYQNDNRMSLMRWTVRMIHQACGKYKQCLLNKLIIIIFVNKIRRLFVVEAYDKTKVIHMELWLQSFHFEQQDVLSSQNDNWCFAATSNAV